MLQNLRELLEPETQVPQVWTGQAMKLYGIGVQLRRDHAGAIIIEDIFQGGSASKCGMLRRGDEIVQVDSMDVENRSLRFVNGMLLGECGTSVDLTVYRRTKGHLIKVSVVRSESSQAEHLYDKSPTKLPPGSPASLPSFHSVSSDSLIRATQMACEGDVDAFARLEELVLAGLVVASPANI
eukprot:748043-Hanusia_phi.AAC.4